MPVSFEKIQIGREYTRPELAELWGYSGFEAISRGVVTPARSSVIVLFITHEKQHFLTQYQDSFEEGVLKIEGEKGHDNDDRMIRAEANGDEIHLFYRARHHQPFTYEGQVFLEWHERHINDPSRFRFRTDAFAAQAERDVATEEATNGAAESNFVPDEEGRRILKTHVSYERSRRNRAEAIRIHGTVCLACGFDFNAVYGKEFARSFIQVHHNKSITQQAGRPVNPATDLSPLCSNCHSMAHRRTGEILTVDQLKALIARRKADRVSI
jgi:5-methylcytosine-specific restriction protein A